MFSSGFGSSVFGSGFGSGVSGSDLRILCFWIRSDSMFLVPVLDLVFLVPISDPVFLVPACGFVVLFR